MCKSAHPSGNIYIVQRSTPVGVNSSAPAGRRQNVKYLLSAVTLHRLVVLIAYIGRSLTTHSLQHCALLPVFSAGSRVGVGSAHSVLSIRYAAGAELRDRDELMKS